MSMTVKVVLGILAIVLLALIAWIIVFRDDIPVDDEPVQNNDTLVSDEEQEISRVLGELPYETTVQTRTIVFDQDTVEQSPRNEYAEEEAPLDMQPRTDPIEYIERHLRSELAEEHISEQPEFFSYEVTLYRLDEPLGISVFVRINDIPDDSVGANEQRFDFVVNGSDWSMSWYGEKVLCRRPTQQFWQPADQPCP